MKVCVLTLGCKVNQYESDSVVKSLKESGFSVTESLEFADVYVVNSCAVTAEAERKSRQMLSRIRALNKDARIIVVGCAAENNSEQFVRLGAEYVSGNAGKWKVAEYLRDGTPFACGAPAEEYEDCYSQYTSNAKAYVKIQDGCNNFCSYCLIPYLRGRSRSRSVASVLEEINNTTAPEIILTGINLSDYRTDDGGLTELILALCDSDKRIRLGSLEVNAITGDFLKALSGLKNFCPQFHLSLQSGSDSVLKSMNRHYTREEFLQKCEMIYAAFPDCALTTDVIVGFPTETERDFRDTLDLMERAAFADAHIFPYSPRKGTKAKGRLPQEIVNERKAKITALRNRLKEKYLSEKLGSEENLLAEEYVGGFTVGYTGNYIRCYLPKEEKTGKIIKVVLKELYLDGVKVGEKE